MFRIPLITILAGAVMMAGSGCSSIVTTSKFHGQELTESAAEPVAHIHSDIWGIYFLGFQSCPIITGSDKNPGSFRLFRDTVTTNTAVEMVMKKSRELGATTVTDLKTDWDSTWQTFTLIFWLKEAQSSGNAVIPAVEKNSESPAK